MTFKRRSQKLKKSQKTTTMLIMKMAWERLSVKSVNSRSSSSGSEPHDCWANNQHICDGNSAAAQRELAIAAHSSGNFSDILQASKACIFSGLPIERNLTRLYKKQNGKGDNTNIAAIVADLEKERSDIITAILDVTSTSGSTPKPETNC